MKKFYLGIDGGATKTAYSLYNENHKQLFTGKVGPASFQIKELFYNSMKTLVAEITEFIGKKCNLSILAGYAGVDSSPDGTQKISEWFIKEFSKVNVRVFSCEIISDAMLVLRAYFKENEPGIVFISGTGSICYAQDGLGGFYRSGGYGHLIDDIGSGFYFGQQAIRLAMEAKYHFKQTTPLRGLVCEHFGVDDVDFINNRIYSSKAKQEIATVSPVFFKGLSMGCEHCLKIYNSAIFRVGELIENNVKRLNSIGIKDSKIKIILHGSVFKYQKIYANDVKTFFKSNYENLRFKIGDKNPEEIKII